MVVVRWIWQSLVGMGMKSLSCGSHEARRRAGVKMVVQSRRLTDSQQRRRRLLLLL